MTKIKLYVVTYKNDAILNEWSLASISQSNYPKKDVSVFVINNYSKPISLHPKNQNTVSFIYNNSLRPDFSHGHLSRNWNQAIINGFKDLNNPDCDIVITCQNDAVLKYNWYYIVENLIQKFDYLRFGVGDTFQIFKPEAIKKIGLFDERFCNIGFQEADYALKALLYHTEKSSINDPGVGHGSSFNSVENDLIPIEYMQCGYDRKDINHINSYKYHHYSARFFFEKWMRYKTAWPEKNIYEFKNELLDNGAPFVKTWYMYPYFEKDIDKHLYALCSTADNFCKDWDAEKEFFKKIKK